MLDLAVIGAGPCGLAVGVAAKRARLTCSLFDKGPVARSLMRYPLYMTFFSTPDKLEIGVPFVEPPPYWQQRVVVVGGGNCAVEAALEMCRVGARVTLVHLLSEFDRGVKPWILPDITNRVKEGRVAVRWCSRLVEIRRAEVVVRRDPDGPRETIPADFVLALTGYTADLSLLRSVGVAVAETSGIPRP